MKQQPETIEVLKYFFSTRPLTAILIVALFVRLIAVFFAPGYMMHDDHFLTVEPSSSWASGHNFNEWLPGVGNERTKPEPISFFYPGALYIIFSGLQALGIHDPSDQMIWVRLLHALYSLLTIVFAYRITQMIADQRSAIRVGWLLALIGILPNFGVRNLVEVVCQPPLLAGFYLLLNAGAMQSFRIGSHTFHEGFPAAGKSRIAIWGIVIAAFIMGLSVGIRYQTVLMVMLVGVVFLLQFQWRAFIVFGGVSFLAFFLTQIDDIALWGGQPFQHLLGYFEYNKTHAGGYPGAPLTYLSFITYFILPPVSLFLLTGFLYVWKKYLLIFLPVFGFLLFHILYPNRQERFILPALPFVVMLGVIGWNQWVEQSSFWKNRAVLHRRLWSFFWVINSIVLLVMCTTYSKRSRVETMSFLYDQGNCRNFIQEFTHKEGGVLLPRHYAGNWAHYYTLNNATDVAAEIATFEANDLATRGLIDPFPVPNYILFLDDTRLDERVKAMKVHFPILIHRATIEAGWFDELLHRLNPLNSVERIHIYEIPDGPSSGLAANSITTQP